MQRPVYMIGRLLFGLITFFMAMTCFAGKATFAPEFTFYVAGIGPRAHPDLKLVKEVTDELIKRCGSRCKEAWGSIVVDGTPIQIEISTDESVFEVHLNHMTLDQLERYEPIIEDVLFQGMRSLGYAPHVVEGAGHLNIGIESGFKSEPRHMKNFLALVMNSQGLPVVFGSSQHDYQFATPIQYFPLFSQKRIAKILSQDKPDEDANSVLKSVRQEYGSAHPVATWTIEYQRSKFVAVGIRDYIDPKRRRFEIRTMRPQQSFKEFVLQARLYQGIIDHTEKLTFQNQKVLFKPAKPVKTVEDAFENFREVVSLAKLNSSDYTRFIAPLWIPIWEQELLKSSKSCKELF